MAPLTVAFFMHSDPETYVQKVTRCYFEFVLHVNYFTVPNSYS